jgi:hypothetical protein
VTLAGQRAGSYVIRFFADDGYALQDELAVTVQ